MPSEILTTGRMFPVPDRHREAETHRLLLAEAINSIASAELTQETQVDSPSADLTTGVAYAAITGLSITIVTAIPARAHVLLSARVIADAGHAIGAGPFNAQLLEGATVVGNTAYWLPTTAAEENMVVVQAVRDLEPFTSYAYTVQAQTGSAGANTYTIKATETNMVIRVEARAL